MPFNIVLKNLRLRKGLSQDELAKATGLKRSAIGMYEVGSREPNFETLEIIADFFNVDMNTLLDRPERSSFRLSVAEKELIQNFRALSDEDKEEIVFLIEHKCKKTTAKVSSGKVG